MTCPACGNETPGAARFCSSCGSAIDVGATVTRESETVPPRRNPSPTGRISSSTSGYEARYVPGTTLVDRYRIVSPLGKGGMGEVYRAEDLKLGQTVALKFLPQSASQTEEALERFTQEVRLARQISHPNVCRVFDIGEIADTKASGTMIVHTFLTMEFVDGEDLASLLRRIGRLPSDKAVEIARQICAGLAAAHEHGIIHRDLKPANIMLDGRGRVRITDFGLAGIAAEIGGADARAGTPAYMSPEQFAGRELTPKSDLYSLGLVLYEIFTGKRPFDAASSEEMARLRDKSAPTAPSQYVKDLDPLVERVILRCLEKDPAKRPASALQVAAALPGGDPLAAALAAGETPSPEMVAASGETEGLRPAVAWTLLVGILILVVASVLFSAQSKLYRRVPLEKTPEELAARSRDILKSLGYTESPVDTEMNFSEGLDFLRYIEEHDQSKTRWDHLETGAFLFWYRGSPRPLASSSAIQDLPVPGMVTPGDPPQEISGMTYVVMNSLGQLTQFTAVPPQVESPGTDATSPASPDWTALFTAAGLDPAKWTRTQPQWTPPSFSDARAAWTGTLAERPELPMRIEAAAFHGRPVYFQLIAPWTTPSRMRARQLSTGEKVGNVFFIGVQMAMLIAGALFARRNLRLGRGDRRGATRIAVVFYVLFTIAWILASHHIATADEFNNFLLYFSLGLSYSAFVWIVYIAMEPYVRRRWPATLVSWSRLLAGKFRDPVVGRDILVGCLLGVFGIAVTRLAWFVPGWMGRPSPMPLTGPAWEFLGLRTTIANLSNNAILSLLISFVFLFVLFIFRALLRKEWAAAIICTLVLTFFRAPTPGQFSVIFLMVTVVLTGLTVVVLMRLGLLAVAVSQLFGELLGAFPLTTQTSVWYAYLSFVGFALVAALVFYGFYISLAGRPIFGGAMLDD